MGATPKNGGFVERATQMGEGLEVANAITDYLNRAGGDARLALAMSVADALAAARESERRQDGSRRGSSVPDVHRMGFRAPSSVSCGF